ncbi:hypothetical protein [Bradyrhizobium sp. 192]|uniref:hypothetical protein n=1 Tax=Bradyrhizobium sp. 192 TaxID=2782660 RepID=UPI0020001A84|nr:hypothetical protein [Bradyrhizobium sp. 192]UPJ61953.1 hypothetical protein IVB24_13320 [Bradyrhizobium sp. 192]
MIAAPNTYARATVIGGETASDDRQVIWDGISIGNAIQTSASILSAFIDVIFFGIRSFWGSYDAVAFASFVGPLWAKFATSDPGTTVNPLHMVSGLVVWQRSSSVTSLPTAA